MDPESLYQEYRKNYYIGNYAQCIELWKENTDESCGDFLMKIDFIVARSLILQTKIGQKIGIGSKKDSLSDQFKGITNLVNDSIGGVLLNSKSTEQIKEKYIALRDDRLKSYVHYVSVLYLGLQCGDLEFVMKSEQETEGIDFPFKDDLEILYLQFLAFLYGNNLTQAKQKLSQMRVVDEEDILTLLSQVYFNMNSGEEKTALQFLEEIKERFGDTGFLINLKVSVLMKQKKFSLALQLCSQLYTLLTTKENLFNKQELEICLTNISTLSDISNKPNEEYIQNLFKLNENALNLQRAQQTSEIFDDFAEKMSQN